MEYPIKFKFDYFGEKGCIEEFRPYSKQLLMELDNQDYYFKEERYIEENKQEKGFIIINDEGEIEEETEGIFRWKDEQDNYTDPCLWDYIADIDVVKRMYECLESINYDINNEDNREKIEEIEKLSEYYWWTQLYLDAAKFDISYICRCDWNENNNKEVNKEILESLKYLEEILYEDIISDDIFQKCGEVLAKLNVLIKSPKANKYIDEIQGWLEKLSNDSFNSSQRKTIVKLIKNRIKSLFKSIDDTIVKKEKFIKRINEIYELGLNSALKREVILSMDDSKVKIISSIIKKINTISNVSYEEKIKIDCETLFNKFGKYLNIVKEKGQVAQYYFERDRCFAIMLNESEMYFALSGYEKSKNVNANMVQLVNLIKRDLFNNKLKINNKNIILRKYEWAYLKDSTKRYVDGDKKDNYIYLNGFEELKDYKGKEPWIYYSCCERKLLEFINTGVLFVRFEPCYKCIPALYGKKIDIYTINKEDNTKEYINCKVTKNKVTQSFKLDKC